MNNNLSFSELLPAEIIKIVAASAGFNAINNMAFIIKYAVRGG
jgi:hypothetical protein